MFRSLHIPTILASVIVAVSTLHADLDTFLEAGQPSVRGGVSHVNDSTDQGMAWKWTPGDGRRDYGQLFLADKAFSANELAVQVLFSDPFRASVRAPFELDLLQFPGRTFPGKPEVIATFKGELPPNPGIATGDPAWLRLRFPSREFQKDEVYGFLLRFLQEGAAEQNIVLRVTPSSTPEGGHGLMSVGGAEKLDKGPSLNFLLGQTEAGVAGPELREVRTLVVDQRATEGYRTVAAAVAEAKPGDTISLAQGSGPYRERLFVRQSGTKDQPIIIEGNGETITGFEPLVFEQKNGEWTCDLIDFFATRTNIQGFKKTEGKWIGHQKAFPAVLTLRGKRVFQKADTGEFLGPVRLSEDGLQLTLTDEAQREGWEISSRDQVVIILNASHHIYRNLKATGSLNDGFNLHGTGTNLVFENIEGSQNLDEGFSSHDEISSVIHGGLFTENDNGIGNVANSITIARDIRTHSNAGWGVWLLNCRTDLENISSWNNGVAQIALHGKSFANFSNVTAVRSQSSTKPWISAQESANRTDSLMVEIVPTAQSQGVVLEVHSVENPPVGNTVSN